MANGVDPEGRPQQARADGHGYEPAPTAVLLTGVTPGSHHGDGLDWSREADADVDADGAAEAGRSASWAPGPDGVGEWHKDGAASEGTPEASWKARNVSWLEEYVENTRRVDGWEGEEHAGLGRERLKADDLGSLQAAARPSLAHWPPPRPLRQRGAGGGATPLRASPLPARAASPTSYQGLRPGPTGAPPEETTAGREQTPLQHTESSAKRWRADDDDVLMDGRESP